MASYTITTDQGLSEFIRLFSEAVATGKRFKTVNIPEDEKDNITSLGDYNFYTNHRDIPNLSSSNRWTVTFDDDAYELPSNIVLPSQVKDESLFGLTSSGRTNGSTLGALLMAIQHYAAAIQLDTSFYPNKSSFAGFISVFDVISRYYTKFNSSLDQYIDLSSAIVLDGDFSVDVTGVMEDEGITSLMGLAGSNSSRLQRIATTTTSTIRFRLSGYNIDLSDDIVTTDGQFRKHTFKRVGDTFSYYEDDVLIDSVTDAGASGKSLGINCLGQSNSLSYYNSYYANFTIEKDGVLVLDMPLDEDGTNGVVYNNAATLGAELDVSTLVTPNSLTTGIVYNNEDSEVTLVDSVGGLSHALALFNDKVLDGSHYLVTITIDTTASSVGAFLGVANSSDPSTERVMASAGEIQTFTQVLSPVGSGSLIFRLIGISALDDTVVFSNISIKEIPSSTPYGTRINMTSTNTELFTLSEERSAWLGENLWDFGSYTFTGSEPQYTRIVGSGSESRIIEGDKYLYKWGCALSGGGGSSQVRLRIGSICDIVTGENASNYEAEAVWEVTSGDDLYVQTGVDPQFTSGTVTVTSVQKVLEIAA